MPGVCRREQVAHVLVLGSALFVLILHAARLGPGITPDSVAYASTARSIANSNSLVDFSGQPLTIFPPGLPFLLGIFVKAGLNLQTICLVLNLMSAGATVWLVYALSSEYFSSVFLGLAAAATFGLSVSTVSVYSMLWTEPVFCAMTLLILFLLMRALQYGNISIQRVWLISTLVSMATLFRYIGVILIPLTVAVVFFSLLRQLPRRALRAALWAITAGGVSSVGFLLVAYRNRTLGFGMMGPRYSSDFRPDQVLAGGLYALGGFFIPNSTPVERFFVGLAFIVVLLYGMWRMLRSGCSERIFLVAFIACYSLALVYSEMTTVLDPIDDRLLAPVFAPMILVMFGVLREIKEKMNVRKGALRTRGADNAIVVCLVLFLVWTIRQSVIFSLKSGREGIVLNQASYRESPLIKAISNEPASDDVASTNPELTYWISKRRPIGRIPRRDHYSPPERTRYDFTQLNHVKYFAFFDEDIAAVSPEAIEEKTGLRLRLLGVFSDGRLYEAVH